MMELETVDPVHAGYYWTFPKGLEALGKLPKAEYVFPDVRNFVVLECDKSWGLCVMNKEDFMWAEDSVIKSIKGLALTGSARCIYNVIKEKEI